MPHVPANLSPAAGTCDKSLSMLSPSNCAGASDCSFLRTRLFAGDFVDPAASTNVMQPVGLRYMRDVDRGGTSFGVNHIKK